MESYVNLVKETVNNTISQTHKEYKEKIELFLTTVDREVKALNSIEKETDKRYAAFEAIIAEAEIAMSKELPFGKDFWLYEHNFILTAS